MPRGAAADSLDPVVAARVRAAVAEARTVKGLTNADLATHLRWDDRTVTSCLQSNRSLRLSKAKELLRASYIVAPRLHGVRLPKGEALALATKVHVILDPVSNELGALEHEPRPAALIATTDYPRLVNLLHKRIADRLTLSAAKKRALKETLERTLRHDGGAFALEAYFRLIAHSKLDPRKPRSLKVARSYRRNAKRVLKRFGYTF